MTITFYTILSLYIYIDHPLLCPLHSNFTSLFLSSLNTLKSFPHEDMLLPLPEKLCLHLRITGFHPSSLGFTIHLSKRNFPSPPQISSRGVCHVRSWLTIALGSCLLYYFTTVYKPREGKKNHAYFGLYCTLGAESLTGIASAQYLLNG